MPDFTASAARTDRAGERADERNALLRRLRDQAPAAHAALAPLLEPVTVATGQALWRADAPIHAVYFPRTAVASLLTPLAGGAPVESATVGREGFVGVPVVLGVGRTHTQALAQIPGEAARADAARFRAWLDDAERAAPGAVLPVFLRYAQALLEQTAQSVACNRRHGMDARCARWLLATRDRVGGDQFTLKHDFLAQMLGVRRASVTVAAGTLQAAGLIRYRRGHVTVLDAARLEAAACECYRVTRPRPAHADGAAADPPSDDPPSDDPPSDDLSAA